MVAALEDGIQSALRGHKSKTSHVFSSFNQASDSHYLIAFYHLAFQSFLRLGIIVDVSSAFA